MASKEKANEAYLEEYNKLDQELKQLQLELGDSVAINDELTKVIVQKVSQLKCWRSVKVPISYDITIIIIQQEEELVAKDKRLDSLRERNLADGDQLDLVSTTFEIMPVYGLLLFYELYCLS